MGERCDNFAHAFNGRSVDWSLVFGMGFDATPKTWTTVYRECEMEDLVRIAREGLGIPDSDIRYPEVRREFELLDRNRTDRIIDMGVKRMDTIGAMLVPEDIGGWQHRRSVLLEMKVDPKGCLVCDYDHLDMPTPITATRRMRTERYQAGLRNYWESAIPLSTFLRHYTKVETQDDAHWVVSKRAPARLPRMYFAPEVLVTTPAISAQHVRIMRGGIIGHQADDQWKMVR